MSETIHQARIAPHTNAITEATSSIAAIAQILEAFRAHAADEIKLDDDEINKLVKNGRILGGLSMAIEILAESINSRTYQIEEALGVEETL